MDQAKDESGVEVELSIPNRAKQIKKGIVCVRGLLLVERAEAEFRVSKRWMHVCVS